ncbi:hypothetical protein BTR23_16365 [Alkalihalophilus pseudofirmus]|nr:hypothetical protein BTR23_16365 [Alkalihalophilus pseudofirmus]
MNYTDKLVELVTRQKLEDTGVLPMEEKHLNPDEWETPVPFDEYNLPQFPNNILPNWIESYVNAVAETTQTPKDAPACLALTILATTLAKKIMVRAYGDWVEPVNLYVTTVLPSANRKSAVMELIKFPILEQEQSEYERFSAKISEQKAKKSGLKKRKEKLEQDYAKSGEEAIIIEITTIEEQIREIDKCSTPRFIVDDITQERLIGVMQENNERLAILSAEGGIYEIIGGRYSNGKANLEIFLKGHSGDYCAVDRMERTEVLNSPALTMGLFVQPDVIQSFPSSFKGKGLLGRHLYSIPQSLVGHRKTRPKPIDKSTKEIYGTNIKKLLQLNVDESIELSLDRLHLVGQKK